jgi:hypothetical protein
MTEKNKQIIEDFLKLQLPLSRFKQEQIKNISRERIRQILISGLGHKQYTLINGKFRKIQSVKDKENNAIKFICIQCQKESSYLYRPKKFCSNACKYKNRLKNKNN